MTVKYTYLILATFVVLENKCQFYAFTISICANELATLRNVQSNLT